MRWIAGCLSLTTLILVTLCRAEIRLSTALLAELEAQASVVSLSLQMEGAMPTAEDESVLAIPSTEGPGASLLYDTKTKRAVFVQELGAEGTHLTVIPPSRGAAVFELELHSTGYFGPEETLSAHGLSDDVLAKSQWQLCQEACVKQPNRLACATCTGVAVLQSLRSTSAKTDSPDSKP